MGENIPACPWDMNISFNHGQSNLQSFLRGVTPVVPVRAHPEDPIGVEGEQRVAEVEFSLGDLWKYYDRPSSHGKGIPVVFDMFETTVQYYSPSLSAIQIFTKHPPSNVGVTDSELTPNCSSSNPASASTKTNDVSNGEESNSFGHLYLQFTETCSPCDMLPLADKIDELAPTYPKLKNFTSSDLTPYSWMAVVWCPIYQIPERDVEELVTCFVTYHYLTISPPGSFPGVTLSAEAVAHFFGSR